MLVIVFVMALGVRPNRVDMTYKIISVFFGIYMLATIVLTVMYIFTASYPVWIIYVILGTAGCFGIGILLHCAVMTVVKGIFHYLFLTPTYVNIFLIYSICNIHDCTWGNRPDLLTTEEKNKIEEFEEFRTRWIIIWVLCNGGYIVMLQSIQSTDSGYLYIYGLAMLAIAIVLLRFCGSLLYLVQENCCKRRLRTKDSLKVVPLVRRASTELNKIENILNSRRSSSFKPNKMLVMPEEIQIITDVEEKQVDEVELVRRKSRKSVNQGVKVDILVVDDIDITSENTFNIREKRFKKGITLKKLCEITGINLEKLRNIEDGKETDKELISVVEKALDDLR